jgi:hypothetical protein
MRMPPGYAGTIDGEEAIMELKRAVYGLKQASASFYDAMDLHLKSKGFTPTLGDPCLYRRVGADGKVIIACLYVDDLLYGVVDSVSADIFLAELRERFEISEGEGAPADFVLYDLDDWAWVPVNDACQQMVFSERGRAVRTVIVDGQVVMQDGRHVRIDRHAILAEARAILGRVRGRNGPIRAIAEMVAAVS